MKKVEEGWRKPKKVEEGLRRLEKGEEGYQHCHGPPYSFFCDTVSVSLDSKLSPEHDAMLTSAEAALAPPVTGDGLQKSG